jgi:hypothetical protein
VTAPQTAPSTDTNPSRTLAAGYAFARRLPQVTLGFMCRSIKTLREPFTSDVTDEEVHAAALQYVRKVSGFRAPAAHNAAAFDHAVAAVTAATQELLDSLVIRSGPARAASSS